MAQEQKAQKDKEDSQFSVESDIALESAGKVLFIVAPTNYRDEELNESRHVVESAGLKPVIASKGVSTANGMLGGSISVDLDISEVNIEDYIAVAFIGGTGTEAYFGDTIVQAIAKRAVANGKIVGAICIAPTILANAGLLEGKNATAFSSEERNLLSHGANYTGKNVTVDGLLVTANGPLSAKAFGEALVKLIADVYKQ